VCSSDLIIMPLPELTHLQFLLLDALLYGELSGRSLRGIMEEQGVRKSSPAFYQLMARLEDGDLVKGRYVRKPIDGQEVRERLYEITNAGRTAHEETRLFYSRPLQLGLKGA